MSISRQNLSVVIVSYISEEVIHKCIESIPKDINILVVDNSGGNTGITFKTPNTASSRVCFGDPEDNNAGQILYNHSNPKYEHFVLLEYH